MRSLQAKFTVALLITSLTAIALVGLISRNMMLRKFDHFVMEESFQRFRADVRAYILTYGSWEKAQQAEPFMQFQRRRQGLANRPLNMSPVAASNAPLPAPASDAAPPDNAPPDNAPPQDRPNDFRAGGNPGLQAAGRPPEDGGPPPDAPPEGGPEPDAGPGPNRQPPQEAGGVPFRFVLLDPQGRILMGDPSMHGQMAPPELRTTAEPIVLKNQVVALAVPIGQPNFTRQDTENWRALEQALGVGVLAASAMTLGLGVFFGTYLSLKLRELTAAIQAMGQGALRQQVRVQSRDEIGVLATAFNRMSADLSQAHEELQQSHEKIQEQARLLKEASIRDELTQLYNRRHFNEQVTGLYAQAERYGQPLTLMIGDIDFFKRINDTFSHATGDVVLRQVAAIMQKQTRSSDIVARYGGEEFVIAFTQTPLTQAVALCERLRQVVETYPWQDIHPDLRVTMSMGLTDNIALGNFENMLAQADEKLYQAKADGRNRVYADGVHEHLSLPGTHNGSQIAP